MRFKLRRLFVKLARASLSKTVVITAGTFLAGQIHIGMNQQPGGRAGDPASNDLANSLRDRPFRIARLKTGTPPRIDSRSVDFTILQEQPGDTPTPYFSMMSAGDEHPRQIPCYLSRTTET